MMNKGMLKLLAGVLFVLVYLVLMVFLSLDTWRAFP